MFTPTILEVIRNDNSNTDQNTPALRKLLTSWFVFPVISLIFLGIFRFQYLGLFFWFLCGDASCKSQALLSGLLIPISWVVSSLIPGLFIVIIFRGLYRLPMLILSIGSLPLFSSLLILFLQGGLTIKKIPQFNQEGFARWFSTDSIQIISLILYIAAFLFFKLLSLIGITVFNRFRNWILTLILILTGALIVISIVIPQVFIILERKITFKTVKSPAEREIDIKTEKFPNGVFYYYDYKEINGSNIRRLNPNGEKESIDISPCETPRFMISWDQRLVYCETGSRSVEGNAHVLINLQTGERRIMKKKMTKDGFLDENYGWPLSQDSWSSDGKNILFSTSKGKIVNTNILYTLNLENMQFSEVYKLDKPGHKLVGAIYSSDKRKIAFLSEDEQKEYHLFIIDAEGKDVSEVPLARVESSEKLGSIIFTLKFSKDGSKIFYELIQFSRTPPTHSYIFNLYDIEKGTNEQIKSIKKYDGDSLQFYDGERSIMFLYGLYKNPGLLRHVFGELQPQPIPINFSFKAHGTPDTKFSSNGEWVFYRNIEGENTWSTWAIRISDGQGLRIMNEGEFLLENEFDPSFVYWFSS